MPDRRGQPLLDINTVVDRPRIAIDNKLYRIQVLDDFGTITRLKLGYMYDEVVGIQKRIDASELSQDEGIAELRKLYQDLIKIIVPELDPDVYLYAPTEEQILELEREGKPQPLNNDQMLAIIIAFIGATSTDQTPESPTDQTKAASQSGSIGEKRYQRSKDSTRQATP